MGRSLVKLSERMELFAREYVIDLNGTRAAIAAGYAESGAHVESSRLLKKAKVNKLIQQLQSKRASKLEITEAKVSEEIARLAFSNMLDYIGPTGNLDLSTLTRDQAAAIQEIREDTTGGAGDGERKLVLRTTFKLSDKTKNLELLCRHLGMLNDKMQVTGLEGLAERIAQVRSRRSGDSRS